jgi:uncharacterized membrane protein YbaN (DUF454 family)
MSAMRRLWTALGYSSLLAGAAGAVLPLLPATPFFILAAFAFSRGSPRVEQWLLEHRRWGPLIRDWRQERAISTRAKAFALPLICATPAASWMLGAGATLLLVQAGVLGAVAVFIVTRPAPGSPDGS